jgi:lon-related putative ATP-dependent protease
VGQESAVDALRFGVGIGHAGYNVFAIGPSGVGKRTLLRKFLGAHAAQLGTPNDWCYVHDFDDPERPRALELPPGMGVRLQRDMDGAVAELRAAMRATFDSKEYHTRKKQIVSEYKERQRRALSEVQRSAREHGIAVIETDTGIGIAALREGEAIDADEFEKLPEPERQKIEAETLRVTSKLKDLLHEFRHWEPRHRETMKALDHEMAAVAARQVLDGVRQGYADFPVVLEHLDQVERDATESAEELRGGDSETVENALERMLQSERASEPPFQRYRINVIVDRSGLKGAPVIHEDNPTYVNLMGRVEHETRFGALITNFTLIRAGALHRAIGGYLILDAIDVLQHPFAWEALKRALQSGVIKIESPDRAKGIATTLSLEPQPIGCTNTKVVLTGERHLYYMLAALDPDFLELFKVLVDFEESMDRKPESEEVYARLIAELIGKEGLRPFDRSAVARIIDHAARAAGDAEKLSLLMRSIVDLLRETDYWASEAKREVACAADVEQAIDAQIRRADRIRRRLQEAIRRQDILVSTSGESIGQINGLSVLQLGEHRFGHPTRITARTRVGRGELVDIEREVELGGPIHSKGVLILGGYLGARYAHDFPLALSASLVFEQSYASVEGDSASMAELCALISSLAEVPLRQSLAITGSVNQHGHAQSIGAVNEKIEGFFDVCEQRGLTGDQGVLVPRSNAKNLMLRPDVVEAVRAGRFAVYAIDHVDDAIELLTGKPAGAQDDEGKFPPETINGRVERKLANFAERAREFFAKPTVP